MAGVEVRRFGLEERVAALARRLGISPSSSVEWRADGRIRELEVRGPSPSRAAAPELVALLGGYVRDPLDGTELRLVEDRFSLAGRSVRYRQFAGGKPVLGGELVLRFDRSGDLVSLSNRLAVLDRSLASVVPRPAIPEMLRDATLVGREPIAFAEEGMLRRAERFVVDDPPYGTVAYDVDSESGEILAITPDYAFVKQGRVFAANPVTALNDPGLRDSDDSALSVPESAYTVVELRDLAEGAGLIGPRVEVIDLESPKTARADATGSLQFDRDEDRFEEVMVYYHLDAARSYIEELGFTGARRVFDRPTRADAHAGTADQSFYRWGAGGTSALFFGDGGVDDAEDPDVIVHEFGHAIQDAIAPFAFATSFASQARAVGEGFGDYWAFSYGYAASLAAQRDAYCIGDWDARCWGGASSGCNYAEGSDCLRRVDSTKTMADYQQREQSGIEHRNGEIWSSALRSVFESAVAREGVEPGRRMADTLVVESHFGVPPSPGFRTMARRMLEADRLLYAGANRAAICAAMTSRGIFSASDCELVPRGEWTLFQAEQIAMPITDDRREIASTRFVGSFARIVEVRARVRIRHPRRGDLRVRLTAPDGRSFLLQAPSNDGTPDIDAVYGLDVAPAESLEPLAGSIAHGTWTLGVTDMAPPDEGSLLSWDLEIRFEGDAALHARPARADGSLFIPAVAHAQGAAGTFFVSDARILNAGPREAALQLVFTPSGFGGDAGFGAFDLVVAPGQQVALDDLVARHFRSAGLGTIEVRGDVAQLSLTSRTYTERGTGGTFGQFTSGQRAADATGSGELPLHVPQLRNDLAFRSNLGFAEVSGASGVLAWALFDEHGLPIEEGSSQISPWGHLQIPLLGGSAGPRHRIVRAVVRVTSGSARILAYGSAVDNQTGDSIFIPGTREWGDAARHVPAVIRGEGAAGTRWRSDLWISNLSERQGTFRLVWFSRGGLPWIRDVTLAAGASASYEDLLGTLFADVGTQQLRVGTNLPPPGGGTGQLRIETDLPAWVAASRAWSAAQLGTYGQWMPALAASEAIGEGEGRLAIPQLINDRRFRTNVGLTEISGLPARAILRVLDGGGREIWSTAVELAALEQRQISLAAAGAPEFSNGYAWVEPEGEGRIAAYGSVVDNVSGDPIYVPALRLSSDD
jgi:subtilisin-like proprotein convertase family protein